MKSKKGWFRESRRHSLAARGITTKKYKRGTRVYLPTIVTEKEGAKSVNLTQDMQMKEDLEFFLENTESSLKQEEESLRKMKDEDWSEVIRRIDDNPFAKIFFDEQGRKLTKEMKESYVEDKKKDIFELETSLDNIKREWKIYD